MSSLLFLVGNTGNLHESDDISGVDHVRLGLATGTEICNMSAGFGTVDNFKVTYC